MTTISEEDLPIEHTEGPIEECPACIAQRGFPTVRVSRSNRDITTEDLPDENF